MTSLQIRVAGAFEDCVLYMGQLFAVTADNQLLTASLEDTLARRFEGHIPAILQFYFLRNDWLNQPLVKDFRAIKEITAALTRAGKTRRVLEVSPDWAPISPMRKMLSKHAVLDLNTYGRRMYVSTTGSLSHFDFSVDYGEVGAQAPVKRLDTRCLATATKFATVVASCGDDGLLAAYDEFGTLSGDRTYREPEAVAQSSLRASWISYSIANYEGASAATFLRGQSQEAEIEGRSDLFVVGFDESATSSKVLDAYTDDADFVFNSSNLFFVQRKSAYQLHHRPVRKGDLMGVDHRIGKGRLGRVLSAHAFTEGLVAETFDEVRLIRPTGSLLIHSGPALKVRTFPASKWVTNVISVVDEEAIHLYSPTG